MTADNITSNPAHGISTTRLLPLDSRELSAWIIVRDKTLLHVFHRIMMADWNVFFAGTENETVNAGALALYHRAILRVEGYATESGRNPEMLPNWPECIPREDRVAAIDSLQKIFWAFAPESVALDGGRASFEVMSRDGVGPLSRYFGVTHHFRTPDERHCERFAAARLTHGTFAVACQLYDELIESAQGYSVDGRELGGKDEIIEKMDGYHKAFAVAVLLDAESLRQVKCPLVPAALGAVGPWTLAGLASNKKVH